MKEFGKVCDAESVMFLLRENNEIITVEFSVVTDSLVEEASKWLSFECTRIDLRNTYWNNNSFE